MKSGFPHIILLSFSILLLSCKTHISPINNYKNIGRGYEQITIYDNDCKKIVYTYKNGKKLNGLYKLKHYLGNIEYSYFKDGLRYGKSYYYDLNSKENRKKYGRYFLRKEAQYKDGLPDGIEKWYSISQKDGNKYTIDSTTTSYQNGYIDGNIQIYERGNLIKKAHYKNSFKDGYEYLFSKKGDTLDVIYYKFSPTYLTYKKISELKISWEGETTKEWLQSIGAIDLTITAIFNVTSRNNTFSPYNQGTFSTLLPLVVPHTSYCNYIYQGIYFKRNFVTIIDDYSGFYYLYYIDGTMSNYIGFMIKNDSY